MEQRSVQEFVTEKYKVKDFKDLVVGQFKELMEWIGGKGWNE